ncbi:hypothetical protein BLA29_003755, partial [Euroglyphus maynei]
MKITDYFGQKQTTSNINKEYDDQIIDDTDNSSPITDVKDKNRMYRLSEILIEENLCDLKNVDETYVYYQYPFETDTIPVPLDNIDDDFIIPLNHILLPFQESDHIPYQDSQYTYNPSLRSMHFDILTNYVTYQLDADDRQLFFDRLLPGIIRLALDLPRLINFNLANLEQNTTISIFLSQQQISSLLANAFLCAYSTDSSRKERRCINFSSLFASDGCKPNKKFCKLEKLKCLLNYLKRVVNETPVGV